MQESLYHSFKTCDTSDISQSSTDILPDELAVDFVACGLTTIAKHYVKNRSDISCSQLEKMIYMLFDGALFER